ncbi:hypothetical protein CspeluHIS016_0205010 [Cutaneotrichosporon spelunceum]|uniref:Uncharacterized protein n=1 Tax=Cutaneotrichosporon spelunceum TaxID=1672016 RepID=A0AAD3Y9Y2_9TREE|nr:hypothetical protein CspeluHIS016_0205010 [Cutaneotrichosporon spelunceum]
MQTPIPVRHPSQRRPERGHTTTQLAQAAAALATLANLINFQAGTMDTTDTIEQQAHIIFGIGREMDDMRASVARLLAERAC